MTDVEQLLLSELRRLADESAGIRVEVARLDERLESVEGRLPAAPLAAAEPEPSFRPVSKLGKGVAAAIGTALGAAVAAALGGALK